MSESNSVSNIVLQCFKCGVISYLVFLLLSCVTAFITLKTGIFKNNLFIAGACILSVSSLLCGYIASKTLKIKGVFSGLISSLFLISLVYITLAVASSFSFEYKAIIVIPICTVLSATSAIISKNTKRRR